jgi:farnesyl-diphosphate farnesyltransferase
MEETAMMTENNFPKDAWRVLKDTSRTFYIPITFLQKELKHTVASAYLALRAIDEIEDHETIENESKFTILMQISELLKKPFNEKEYLQILEPVSNKMPEVTLRLGEWLQACPESTQSIVMDTTSQMAFGMAKWVKANWLIQTREDLNDYTYYVAGLVGVMLSELWEVSAGIKTDRELAIGYGRGLQAINMLRNEQDDLTERGVSFLPDGWTRAELFDYAEENLAKADEYIKQIDKRSIVLFCRLPLALAHKTFKAMKDGRKKMTRAEVEQTVVEIQTD